MTVKGSPGEDAYQSGDYLTASEYYQDAIEKDPDNPALHYNYGATAYKNNMYDDAIASFNEALKSSDLQLQEKAYYNRGTAQFKKGEETLQADSQKTIKNWQDALASYDSCLKLQPENEEAKFNYDLVQKELEELKKQEQQKKKEKSEQNEQNEQNEQKNTGDNQDKQEQGEQKQEQQPPADSGEEEQEQNHAEEQQKEEEQQAATTDNKESEPNESQEEKQSAVPGKLSKEEAEQLLNELREEEGHLNFIPKGIRKPDNNRGENW